MRTRKKWLIRLENSQGDCARRMRSRKVVLVEEVEARSSAIVLKATLKGWEKATWLGMPQGCSG